jgi:hypothetical protein
MKNTVSLTVLFFARNRKQFRLINETEIHFVNCIITTKRNTVETEFVDSPSYSTDCQDFVLSNIPGTPVPEGTFGPLNLRWKKITLLH